MKSSYYLDVLRGKSEELPDVRSKVVRVFVSSTFTDTLTERDSLIENIFPKLKDYCREKYGLEFQYADMRWGIQTESVNNHGETATCLKEIEQCKKYSVATNFVVLLSHRYGSRPIPAEIRASIFDPLKQVIYDQGNENYDGDLLTQWYKLDTNHIPPVYILQNISSIIPKFLSKNPDEVKQADNEWKKVNNRLRVCLRRAAEICLQQGHITENDYDEFFISITEREIINGILSANDANERTLCFLREIVDIKEHLSDDKAAKYIDMSSKSEIDHEAERLLKRLKTNRIPNKLRSQNIYKYRVSWSKNGINSQDHHEYIEEFNENFFTAMKEQIDRSVQTRYRIGSDSLQHEVLEHAIQCKSKKYTARFHGRSDILSKLEQYIKTSDENRPFVVYGDSGCGKTNILARLATEIFKWWSGRSVSVVLRFLGTTLVSSTIYKTLLSISEQICELYNLQMTPYPTVNQLRDQLESSLLSQIPDNEYLLIVLDSIDQLHNDAYDCKWLPKRLPANVKCILSTLPDHGNIYQNLRTILNEAEHLFVHVPPFEPSTVEIIYNDWLQGNNRAFSIEQRTFITNFMVKRKKILPLFMKIFFDIISVWHSYDPIDQRLNDLHDVDDCIRYLFQRLKVIHNEVLFSRALCYMTACRSGISQNELEDVLSLDDDVLKSVFQHYIPPVRRLPGILWTRIRNDLDEYITEKEVDDVPVIYWYHRRFIEVAKELYISSLSSEERKIVFQNVVDLYKETWKGRNKPFKIDDPKLVTKYKLDKSDGEIPANRFTTSQPIEFTDVDGRIQYNKRKLNELPQFLLRLAPDISIPIAAEEVIFNYSFMHAKYSCSSYDDIRIELNKFSDASPLKSGEEIHKIKREISIINLAYLLFGLLLNEYSDNFAFELTSRLLILYGLTPNITNLLKQCDELSPKHCALIVPYCQMSPPGNGLIYSMNKHAMPVVDFDFTNDESAGISLSDKIIVINMRTGNTAVDIKLPKLNEPYLNSTTLPRLILHSSDSEKNESSDDDDDEGENEEKMKKYVFFVNSHHHIYLVSSHGDIKFHRNSKKGYLTVEIINKRRGLCILVEENSNIIECWDLGKNELFSTIVLPSDLLIKKVLCSQFHIFLLSIVLHNGTIQFYSLNESKFIYRGLVNIGQYLDLIIADKDKLIGAFNAQIPIDFVHIDLNLFSKNEDILSDNEIMKTLISFDPPITPKPIERIILPEQKDVIDDKSMKIFFIALTKESACIVHTCLAKNLSYLAIPGHFDVASIHVTNPRCLFASQRGVVHMYRWRCIDKDESHEDHHTYQLFISIDISSSAILTIKPCANDSSLFLCSMENGSINMYHTKTARKAFKKIPPFPRTCELMNRIYLSESKAITLDKTNREITVWLYQHSTSIESTRTYPSTVNINDFAVLSDLFVLIVTNNNWAEIYSLKSLNKEAIFRLYIGHLARVFSFDNKTFVLLSSDGKIHCLVKEVNEKTFKSIQTSSTKQLNINCAKLFCSILKLNSNNPSLATLADDKNSLALWTFDKIIYIDIKLLDNPSINLFDMKTDKTQNQILFYFENKTLISCDINLSNENSYKLFAFENIDLYSLKSKYLATISHERTQLNFYDTYLNIHHNKIELENECEQLCLNENGEYTFVLVKPRILCMYRIKDHRQLARLFLYDHVVTMDADKEFIVLSMNDRRLLTLLIADPDDSILQSKIQALPSREFKSLKSGENSVANDIVEQMEDFLEMDSDDSDADSDIEDLPTDTYARKHVKYPITSYRYVHHLNRKLTLNKMQRKSSYRKYFLKHFASISDQSDSSDIIIDDDDEDSYENSSESMPAIIKYEYNLDDIRQKTLEHDQQQVKGIEFANAGTNNIKIINNYSITSSTCNIQ